MVKFIERTKGAVSVFLIMIMLPMMLFSWLMIDSARIKLATARVVNATDLTINTALSNYDNILKDMYGLFAMSQSKEELFENLDEYYTRNLQVAGLDEDTASYLSNNIINNLLSLDLNSEPEFPYADFIKPIPTDNSFSTKRYYTSSLANPEIMKDQIVNFMKYRAPLGVGLKLLEMIKSFETVDSQAKVVEDKTAYYEAQSTLEEKLRAAWGNIEKYKELYNGASFSWDSEIGRLSKEGIEKLQEMMSEGQHYENGDGTENRHPLKENIENVICYQLIMTEVEKSVNTYSNIEFDNAISGWKFKYFEEFPFDISVSGETYTIKYYGYPYTIDFNSEKENDDSETNEEEGENVVESESNSDKEDKEKEEKAEKLNTWLKETLDIIDKENSKITYNVALMLSSNYSSGINSQIGSDNDPASLVGYFYRDFNSTSLEFYVSSLIGELDKSTKGITDENATRVKSLLEEYKNIYTNIHSLVNNYAAFTNTKAVEVFYSVFVDKLNKYYEVLEKAEKYLANANKYLKEAAEYLSGTLNEKKDAWMASSNAEDIKGSQFSDENKKEIETIDGKFKKEDIERLQNIIAAKKDTVCGIKNAINGITFRVEPGGTEVTILSERSIFGLYTKFKAYHTNIDNKNFSYSKSKLDYFKDFLRFNNFDKDAIDYDKIVKDVAAKYPGINADLEFKNVNSPLYNDMNKKYHGAGQYINDKGEIDDSKNKEGEKDKKNQVKDTTKNLASEELTKEAKTTPENAYKAESAVFDQNAPSKVNLNSLDRNEVQTNTGSVTGTGFQKMDGVGSYNDSGDFKDATKAVSGSGSKISSFFGDIFDALADIGETLRDVLYIEEYIMGMFSYKTMEKEAYTEANASNIGESVGSRFLHCGFYLYGNDGKQLTSDYGVSAGSDINIAKVLAKMETLTNIQMSPELNKYYLEEVEYMIYGENGASDVETTIFAIRFVLNTISAFMNSELNSIARTIALACFGCPPLTFLVPIAQIAIIIACAIGESFIDKTLIMGGFEVPVFKTSSNWICSPSGIAREVKDVVVDTAKSIIKKGIAKVSSEIEKFVDGLSGKIDDGIDYTSQEMKTSLEGCLNDAYAETVGGYVDEVTNTLIRMIDMFKERYCQETEEDFNLNDATTKITQDIKGGLKDFLGVDPNSNDLASVAKNTAIDLIVNNASEYIEPMVKEAIRPLSENGTVSGLNADDVTGNCLVTIPKKIKDTVITYVKTPLDGAVDKAGESLKGLKDDAVSKVMVEVKDKGENLQKKADEFIDGLADKVPDKVDSAGNSLSTDAGKAFSLGYSGYLRIFLIIALLTNQDGVLKRMADIMQANMQISNSDFEMYKAYTYIDIDVAAEVKPLFFSFDGLNRLLKSWGAEEIQIGKMYKINYSERSGY